jgi:hypothetical protein
VEDRLVRCFIVCTFVGRRRRLTMDDGLVTMDMTYLSRPTANGLEALLVLFKRSLERQDAHQRTLHPMWLCVYLYYTATGSKTCLHLNRMDAMDAKEGSSGSRPVVLSSLGGTEDDDSEAGTIIVGRTNFVPTPPVVTYATTEEGRTTKASSSRRPVFSRSVGRKMMIQNKKLQSRSAGTHLMLWRCELPTSDESLPSGIGVFCNFLTQQYDMARATIS